MKRSHVGLAIVIGVASLSGVVNRNSCAQSPINTATEEAPSIGGKEYTGPVVATPRGLDGHPDFTGFWKGLRDPKKPGGNLGKDEPDFRLPFSALGLRALSHTQDHTVDPEAQCFPGGIPRHNGSGLPFEVVHTPVRIAFNYLYNTHRLLTIDAMRKLRDAPAPTYFGTSVSRWEGDTLVVETAGLRDSSLDHVWLDENGNPTSSATRVLERWTRPDFHHLRLEMTVTDLRYYTRPFTFTRTWVRGGPKEGATEYACNEANLAGSELGPGPGPIGPDGNRGFGYDDPLPAEPPGPEAYEQSAPR